MWWSSEKIAPKCLANWKHRCSAGIVKWKRMTWTRACLLPILFTLHMSHFTKSVVKPLCPIPSLWPKPISLLWYRVLSRSICLTWADFTPLVQCAVPVYLFWPEPISPLWYSVLSHSICLTWADFTPLVQCAVPFHLFDLIRFHPFGTVCCPILSVWPEPISPLWYSVLSQSICLTSADFTPLVQCAVPFYLFDLSRFQPSGTVCCPSPSVWPEPISPLRYSVLSRSICFDLSRFHPSGTVCCPIPSLWPEPISPLRYSVLSQSICLTSADFTPLVQCAVPFYLFDLSRFHPSGTVCCPIPSLWPDPISPLRYSVLSQSICFTWADFNPLVQCAAPSGGGRCFEMGAKLVIKRQSYKSAKK